MTFLLSILFLTITKHNISADIKFFFSTCLLVFFIYYVFLRVLVNMSKYLTEMGHWFGISMDILIRLICDLSFRLGSKVPIT